MPSKVELQALAQASVAGWKGKRLPITKGATAWAYGARQAKRGGHWQGAPRVWSDRTAPAPMKAVLTADVYATGDVLVTR